MYAAGLIGGWGGTGSTRVVGDLGLLGFALFAAVCAGLATRSASGRQRSAWMFLTIGVLGWAVRQAIWSYYHQALGMEQPPFPAVSEIAYLLFPVGACLALVLLPAGYAGQSRIRMVLDGLIVAGALFVVFWAVVLHSAYTAGDADGFAVAVSLIYPVSDIVVLTVALSVLARARAGQRFTLMLLTAGIVLKALSDSAFAYLIISGADSKGDIIDAGWAAALLMLSLAALLSLAAPDAEEHKPRLPSRASTWLPYLPLLAAAVVCAPKYLFMSGVGPVFASALLLMAAVLARQFVVVRENRLLLETVADQALRDPLTGLANRELFRDHLTHAMQLRQRDNRSVAVLVLDLDEFKLVNDSLGHPAGDALLTLVAERILGCVRPGDTVARLGGDEFAVLLEGRVEQSRRVAHRVMRAFDAPFLIEGHDLLMRPSVGLAVASADDTEISADALLKQADVAMYSAKRSRAGGVHTFSPDMYLTDAIDPAREGDENGGPHGAGMVRLLGQLRHAIDHVGLSLVYQPKIDLRDDAIVGVEALVRWPHPERGLLGPEHFLPLVRQYGLMRSVTEIVLSQALDDAARWRLHGVEVPVAVNVFAPSLGDLKLPMLIEHELALRRLRPDTLTVEITEDLLLDDVDRTRTVLDRLRQNGIRVAIDYFGSGYSALQYLRDLSIDEVKLDREFITPILVDRRAAVIVGAVIGLAQELGLTTVAEGVESAAIAARLREYGCDVAQGYYYSPPLAASDMLALLLSARTPQDEGTSRSEIELMQ